MDVPVLAVSQVNEYIKGILDRDGLLAGLFVRGEISNYKAYPSGHHYFSLKDEQGAIRCVMFRREAMGLKFRPENGMKVLAYGRVSAYVRDGAYQLYCSHLSPQGVGDLHVAFEQLKEKLYKAGLFDEAHKKPLPRFPRRIAIVTSPVGAAIRDMLRILAARYPLAEVVVLPVRVQGAEAAAEIAGAIRYASDRKLADLLITGRGGGSMEDLWCFNEEVVAWAIYDCEIPVISAVGHEPDVTIADFVADLRAATPSNAAELAVPDRGELYGNLAFFEDKLYAAVTAKVKESRKALRRLGASPALHDPMAPIKAKRLALDYQTGRAVHAVSAQIARSRAKLAGLAGGLDAMSPLKVLSRGYAIPRGEKGIIKSTGDIKSGEHFSLRVTDGEIPCQAR